MNKRILVVLFFAVFAIISISAIQAVSAEKVTISGYDFNIPDGFEENETFEIDNFVNVYGETINAKGYVNGNDVIYICVMSCEKGNFSSMPDEGDVSERIINGITGYIDEKVILLHWDGKVTSFSYMNGTDKISITVSDESLIDKVLIY